MPATSAGMTNRCPKPCYCSFCAGSLRPATNPHAATDGERERDQHVVSRERQAEERPRRLVAARDVDRLQLLEQVARSAEVGRAAAGVRSRPPLPLDAGVIAGEPGVPQHQPRDHGQRRQQDPAAAADRFAEQDHHRQRDAEIVGIALFQAERARPITEAILEIQRAQDGRGAADRHHGRGRDDRACLRPRDPGFRARLVQSCVHTAYLLLVGVFLHARVFPCQRLSACQHRTEIDPPTAVAIIPAD